MIYVYSDDARFANDIAIGVAAQGEQAAVVSFGDKRPESCAKEFEAVMAEKGIDALLVGSTVSGRELGAAVAGYADCGMLSDVASLSFEGSTLTASRTIYGGSAVSVEHIDGFGVASIAPGAFPPANVEAPIVELDLEQDDRVSVIEVGEIARGEVDLAKAKRVVGVGLGMNKAEDMAMATELAEELGAAIGCTRDVAENRGWLPKSQYIGITGVSIAADLYLSMGVSGQMQHVFGIRDSKIIVAIDKNAQAPIFRAADYGIVGDMYEVVPAITRALRLA